MKKNNHFKNIFECKESWLRNIQCLLECAESLLKDIICWLRKKLMTELWARATKMCNKLRSQNVLMAKTA